MKKLTVLLFLFQISLLGAQKIIEIPLKKGMANYVFEHKLDNTMKCLSSYVDCPLTVASITPFQQKIITKTNNFSFTNSDNLNLQCFILFERRLKDLKCIDTLKYSSTNLTINLLSSSWNPSFLKKKATGNKLTANISFVFLSKNEYKLIIKDR